jgi:hypothetical protein
MLHEVATQGRTVTKSGVLAEIRVSVLATTAKQAQFVAEKARDYIVLETTHDTNDHPITITDCQKTESSALISFTIAFDPVTV